MLSQWVLRGFNDLLRVQCVTASDGLQAVDAVKARMASSDGGASRQFDVILTDIIM